MKITRADVEQPLRQWLKEWEDVREQFINSVRDYPLHAFEWSQDEFRRAGRVRVARRLLEAIKERRQKGEEWPVILRDIYEYALGETIRAAKYPKGSSMVTSNLAEQSIGMAWATFVDYWRWRIENAEDIPRVA